MILLNWISVSKLNEHSLQLTQETGMNSKIQKWDIRNHSWGSSSEYSFAIDLGNEIHLKKNLLWMKKFQMPQPRTSLDFHWIFQYFACFYWKILFVSQYVSTSAQNFIEIKIFAKRIVNFSSFNRISLWKKRQIFKSKFFSSKAYVILRKLVAL